MLSKVSKCKPKKTFFCMPFFVGLLGLSEKLDHPLQMKCKYKTLTVHCTLKLFASLPWDRGLGFHTVFEALENFLSTQQ